MKPLQSTLLQGAAALAALLALAAPGRALPQDGGEAPAGGDEAAKEEDEDEEKKQEEEEEERWFAIAGADVHTGNGAVLRGATILARNGKIEEIGYDLFLPEGTEKLDAAGYRVYPGLVAVSASTRITRGTFSADAVEPEHEHDRSAGPEAGDPLHPGDDWSAAADPSHATDEAYEESETRVALEDPPPPAASKRPERPDLENSFDPYSGFLVMALSAGITTLEQSGTAAKLKRGEIDGVAMKEKFLTTLSWSSTGRAALREKFQRASEYLRELEVYEEKKATDKELKEPDKKGVDSSVVDVLEGRKLAKFNADETGDLLGIARFAQQYRFRPVIEGCREGWTVAEELGRAGAYAIVTPRDRRPKDERLVREGGSSIENAALLHAHGVQVAIIPSNTGIDLGGITGRDLLHFPVEAGFAVRGGMSNDAALAGITIIPARILGVDHRVGTLEAGKDLDAIVTDGDVLHYQTFVQWTVVDGKIVYDKQKELIFHHIRPRPEPVAEEAPEVDQEQPEAAEEAEEEPPAEEEKKEDDAGGEEGGDGGGDRR